MYVKIYASRDYTPVTWSESASCDLNMSTWNGGFSTVKPGTYIRTPDPLAIEPLK